jgi:predicted MFS family arabinose efflux permease
MGLAFTSLGALIPEVVSADARGLAMGGYNSAIYLGMMLGSLVMGMIIGRVGFSGAFYAAALINVITAAAFQLAFAWRRRSQEAV